MKKPIDLAALRAAVKAVRLSQPSGLDAPPEVRAAAEDVVAEALPEFKNFRAFEREARDRLEDVRVAHSRLPKTGEEW